MADLALALSFEGDYGYKVYFVDEEDTIATAIKKAADQIVGVFVPALPDGTVLKLRVQGQKEALPDDVTVKEAGLVAMACVEVYRAS